MSDVTKMTSAEYTAFCAKQGEMAQEALKKADDELAASDIVDPWETLDFLK